MIRSICHNADWANGKFTRGPFHAAFRTRRVGDSSRTSSRIKPRRARCRPSDTLSNRWEFLYACTYVFVRCSPKSPCCPSRLTRRSLLASAGNSPLNAQSCHEKKGKLLRRLTPPALMSPHISPKRNFIMPFSFDAVLASRLVPARFRASGNLEKHGPDISSSATKEAELTARLARFARVPALKLFE